MQSLAQLHAVGNELSGSLPPEWGASALTDLLLSGNPLSGGLPSEWAEEGMGLNVLALCETGITGMCNLWIRQGVQHERRSSLLPANNECTGKGSQQGWWKGWNKRVAGGQGLKNGPTPCCRRDS